MYILPWGGNKDHRTTHTIILLVNMCREMMARTFRRDLSWLCLAFTLLFLSRLMSTRFEMSRTRHVVTQTNMARAVVILSVAYLNLSKKGGHNALFTAANLSRTGNSVYMWLTRMLVITWYKLFPGRTKNPILVHFYRLFSIHDWFLTRVNPVFHPGLGLKCP